jgi:hypothetical protein
MRSGDQEGQEETGGQEVRRVRRKQEVRRSGDQEVTRTGVQLSDVVAGDATRPGSRGWRRTANRTSRVVISAGFR